MTNAQLHHLNLASIPMHGTTDRWELWKSAERVGTDNSWVGVVTQRPDGTFFGRPGDSPDMLGPFRTLDEASRGIAAALDGHS